MHLSIKSQLEGVAICAEMIPDIPALSFPLFSGIRFRFNLRVFSLFQCTFSWNKQLRAVSKNIEHLSTVYYVLIYILADESKSENKRSTGFLNSFPTTKEPLQVFTICNLLNLFGEGLKQHFYQSKKCISKHICRIYSS